MRKALFLTAVCGLLVSAGPTRAEDEARAILDKAVKAHGGLEKVAKAEKAPTQARMKGTVYQPVMLDVTIEASTQEGKGKQVVEGELMGNRFTQVVLFDGKTVKIYFNGKEIKLDEKKLAEEAKEEAHAAKVVALAFADKKKGYELSPLGEVKVDGKPAVGVRVSSPGHRDINLFFDKANGLLVKTERQSYDFATNTETAEEKILSEYKEFEGIRRPTKVVVLHGGKKHITLEIEDIKLVDKFDDDFFTKP